MSDIMTSKECWLAALQLQPVDRLPFWPKLDKAYPRAQVSPFCKMELNAIHDWIGSDKHIGIPDCTREIRKTTSLEIEQQSHLSCRKSIDPFYCMVKDDNALKDGDVQIIIFRTRYGSAKLVKKFDLDSQSWHPVEFPVKNLDDIKVMAEWFSDCSVELERRQLEEARACVEAIGSQAVTATSIGRSPFMLWVEWLAGVMNAHYLLADYRNEVEALFEVIHRNLLKKTEILCEYNPCDILYFVEDTSTTLISPAQYRQYCYRYIQEYGLLARNTDRLLALHMCGHLKALLPDLARLPVAGFEAFTSPPVGNTTLLDGRTACPDKCLIGGTNAMLWTRSAGEIIAKIEEDLDVLPHHRGLVVTSAGIMPSLCRPETIRRVCQWMRRYKARM
ncbi:hypothetical protein KAV79_02465 [Candidatus Aerophobetes bacterium]|nr:hypothetical protein [Candidatus Aerophobetes bacterium]